MRKVLSMLVVAAVTAAGAPAGLVAADLESIALTGVVYTSTLHPLSNTDVQIRDLTTGARVNSTVSDADGEFAFPTLRPGSYVIEVVNGNGKVLGMSAPFRVGSVPNVNVSVVAVAQGLVSSGQESGRFSLLGLGPVTSLTVLGAAGAAGVTAVVATRPNASPSR